MTLRAQLDAHKKAFQAKAPQATLGIMQQALEELRQSPVMERAIKLGAAAPRFALRNTAGKRVSLNVYYKKDPWC